MIAVIRRMATLDFLLVALAATVTLLAFWPTAGPRQTFLCRDASGYVQRYSLAADDPKLQQLAQATTKSTVVRPSASLAKLKWLAETADFYVDRTAAKQEHIGFVQPVSFQHNRSSTKSTREADVLLAEQKYWTKVRQESSEKIAEVEAELRHRQSLSVPPSIVLGDVIRGGHSLSILVASTLLGVCVAGIFALWTYASPPIQLQAAASSTDPESCRPECSHARQLRVVIPSRWVRVHQPASVTIRRIAQIAVVIAGLACVLSSIL